MKTCLPAKLKLTVNGKKEILDGFEVILEDTILFPEGGGQVMMSKVNQNNVIVCLYYN